MRTSRRAFIWSAFAGVTLAGSVQTARATSRQQAMGPEDTAVLLAQFEASGDLTSLLTYLHRDARAIIPEGAIIGWYRNVWLPTGPGPISVTSTTYRAWTWAVNGATYPNTAEISFTQPFGDGTVAQDVVRLVEYDGVWHWFFGRNLDFVNEQIATYTPGVPLLTAEAARAGASVSNTRGSEGNASTGASSQASRNTAPFGVRVLTGLSEDAFLALAPNAAGTIARSPRVPERSSTSSDGTITHRMITYYNDPNGELYPVGVVGTSAISGALGELGFLDAMRAPVRGEGGGMITPTILQSGVDGGVHYQMQREFASEAVGNATNLYFTVPGSGIVYVIGAVEEANLAALAEAMVSRIGRPGA